MLPALVLLVALGDLEPPKPADLSTELPLDGRIDDAVIEHPLSLGRIRVLKLAADDHPNELWRLYALEALVLDRPAEAQEYFERSAWYGDKYSQHRLSLMHWHGTGDLPVDHATAYVWADLAAERGYQDLLLIREKMWQEMSADERDRALNRGPAFYAKYGDKVAKPRLAKRLKTALWRATGSRTGFEIDRILVTWPNEGAAVPVDFWARERWHPREYWKVEDSIWGGNVEVLPPIPADRPNVEAER